MQSQTIEGLANEALIWQRLNTAMDDLIGPRSSQKCQSPPMRKFRILFGRTTATARCTLEVRPMIIQQLKRDAAGGVIETYMAGLQANMDSNHLHFPTCSDSSHHRWRLSQGSQDGAVEIVVLCRTMPLLRDHRHPRAAGGEVSGKLHVVFRDFPLNFHDQAIPAAIAANCAGEQGNDYWAMHNLLMSDQRNLTDKNFKWAKDIGLEMGAFKAVSDPEVEAEVDADYKDGMAQAWRATVFNGLKLTAGPSYDAMMQMIDRELAEG